MSSSATATTVDYRSLMAPEMAEVDAVIHRRLSSQVALVNQISHYIVNAGVTAKKLNFNLFPLDQN